MLLGLSSPLYHESAKDWAQKHKALGLGAVNFPVTSEEPKEKIMAYKQAADEAGLVIAEVGVWRNAMSADLAEREAAIQYSINQLKMADEIGALCCVNIVGTNAGPVWDGGYAGNFSEETFELAVKIIQRIIDEAKPKKTKFSIEPMPWMIPTGPDEYLRLIKAVDREAFGVHMDMINMINCPERYFFNEAFMDEIFEKLGDKICSCHIKNVYLKPEFTFQLVECACEDGTLNLKHYAELATKADKNMPMIIEHLHTDEEYLRSLAYCKEHLKEYISNGIK